ncbi:MAG: ABC transporter ATP-binding protein [Lachnospiraceae bacterium]|nr:ABC transporter ATP-binding protein [Lachnospiraceae bacterium]
MSESVITVNHISKVYKLYDKPMNRLKEAMSITKKSYHSDHFALDDISFDVKKGECVGIIGTNGSGKSTLLKILTGVLNPSGGSYEVNGKISALLELGAGFNMEYTGIENIYLNGTMMGFSDKEMEKKIDSIVAFAEIGDFINQPVKTYSSGMFARLAFAVAINVEPDILIVDEALSVGDIFFQAKCYQKFNEFKEKGKTILFVSHDMSSVLKYCDRCLLIDKGHQISIGKTSKVVDIYKKILVNQYDGGEIMENEEPVEGQENKIEFTKEETGKFWKEKMLINPNIIDYGGKEAEIIDFAVVNNYGEISNSIYKGEEFAIRMKIRFHKDIVRPIFAFTIKDIKGTEITGTNTMLEEKNLEEGKAGQVVSVQFKQRMDLQGGQYLLSLGCTGYEVEEFVVYNRLYDACNIEVLSTRNTIGFYDMKSEVEYL